MWHFTESPPNTKLRCCCSGNCRGQCPGRTTRCPNVAAVNLPGRRSDVLCLPSRDADTETQRDRHTDTDTQPHRHKYTDTQTPRHTSTATQARRHADTVTQTQTQALRNPDAWVANRTSSKGEKRLKKVWRPLCSVCRCQVPGCRASARKPHGQHLKPSNFGLCQKHWK